MEVRQAGVSPKPPVETKPPEYGSVDASHTRQQVEHHCLEVRRKIEIETQPEGRHPGQSRSDDVVQEDDDAPRSHAGLSVRRMNRAQDTSTATATMASSALPPMNAAACIGGAAVRPRRAAVAQPIIAPYAIHAVFRWPSPMRTI